MEFEKTDDIGTLKTKYKFGIAAKFLTLFSDCLTSVKN